MLLRDNPGLWRAARRGCQACLDRHTIHPTLLQFTTPDAEAQAERFSSLEPADVVAECTRLSLALAAGGLGDAGRPAGVVSPPPPIEALGSTSLALRGLGQSSGVLSAMLSRPTSPLPPYDVFTPPCALVARRARGRGVQPRY